MTPVMQQVVDKGKGDCMRACIASLFDIAIEDVPNFMDSSDSKWYLSMSGWLWERGWEHKGTWSPDRIEEIGEGVGGYFMMGVPSLNFVGGNHAVVFKGTEFVHDPSPKQTKQWKFEDVKRIHAIVKKEGGNE